MNKLKANELAYLWPTRQHNLLAGPKILPISPFGRATNRDFRERTRLWPLYTTLWCWPGQDMGLIVPSTNPKQVSRGAPFAWITAAYSCNIAGLWISKFHHEIRWSWVKKIRSIIVFVIMLILGAGLAKRWIMSKKQHVCEKHFRCMQSPSILPQIVLCQERLVIGNWSTFASDGMSSSSLNYLMKQCLTPVSGWSEIQSLTLNCLANFISLKGVSI